jgi:hypothetical protein
MTQVNNGSLKPKLQLSNGYSVNFTYLARILNAICHDQRERVPQTELAASVGFTERHVKHLCGIAHALGLTERITYTPTPLGRLVHKYDPFFDDIGTLWFLHYMISSNPYNLVWNRFVTEILPPRRNITREQARAAFNDLRQTLSEYSIQKHVLQELNTVVDAYTNQNFVRLNYLHLENDIYILGKAEPVPPLVLGACIVCFRDRQNFNDTAVSVKDLLTTSNGPGVVMQLGEDRLRGLLEQLKVQPGFSLESQADLDQVRLTDNTPSYVLMERYYVSK